MAILTIYSQTISIQKIIKLNKDNSKKYLHRI